MASVPPTLPRKFPTSGFVTLDSSSKIEEEQVPLYVADRYYPVRTDEVFASKYQVVSKLGFGTSSTVWLCRDLRDQAFYTLKVCVRGKHPANEILISEHLKNSNDHSGKNLVRLVLDSFEVNGPHGKHTCLVYQPLGMSFTEFQHLLPDNKLSKELVQRSVQLILIASAFLHENDVIHTDISSNNILQGIGGHSILCRLEEDEMKQPIARKVLSDRNIYYSRPMPSCVGLPVLSDLGEARVGTITNKGDIMPGIYRAPEVILEMGWDSKVDIWLIGTMIWDLVEGRHLFFVKKDRQLSDEQHLAEMISLMGPPPPEFLRRSNWKGSIPIPEQSLEMQEHELSSTDKDLFLRFLRRIFHWLPEERPTAEDLAYDDFLMQPMLAAGPRDG